MAATCPKCLEQLPRQVLWKGLKSGTLDKAEITCPQCGQVLRITPKSDHPGNPARCADSALVHLFPGPPRLDEIVILVFLVLMPLMTC